MRSSLTRGLVVVMMMTAIACGRSDSVDHPENDDTNDNTTNANDNTNNGDPDYFTADDGESYPVEPPALLGVDASRSGIIDFDDPDDLDHRYEPSEGFGALFLANLDDDAGVCNGLSTDEEFEECYDARRIEVSNDSDLTDMARIKTKPTGNVSPETSGVLDIDEGARGWVRLYKRTGDDDTPDAFTPYEPGEDVIDGDVLEDGVEFVIEGKALVNDDEGWDGEVELSWEIEVGELDESVRDRAHINQAPVLFSHHLHPAKEVYATDLGNRNAEFRADLEAAVDAAGVDRGLHLLDLSDPWTQDYMLTGYMAIPGPDGPEVIRMYFRSANLNQPESTEPIFHRLDEYQGDDPSPLLREAGRVVFTDFHGSDVAGRAEYDGDKGFEPVDLDGVDIDDALAYLYGDSSDQEYPEISELVSLVFASDTLDSFGNTETVPPHVAPDGTHYPHGRVVRGQDLDDEDVRPDPTLTRIIDSQGAQPIIWLDTYWKLVAHVDETISYVQTDTDRGWSVLYADPTGAKDLLESVRDDMGGGNAVMFEDRSYPGWGGGSSAERTVNEVLNDTEIMEASARAAVEVQAQTDILQHEVGLDDEDFVGIPFLHEDYGQGSLAYQPGIVNGISLKPDVFGAPDPLGPVIDGEDVVQREVEDILNPLGVDLHWIEIWDVYHVGVGHVHCASNVIRETPATPWWAKEMN